MRWNKLTVEEWLQHSGLMTVWTATALITIGYLSGQRDFFLYLAVYTMAAGAIIYSSSHLLPAPEF